MSEVVTASITIARDPREVYAYLCVPTNFPRWSLFITAIERDGADWRATTLHATVRVRFCALNDWGLIDHWVSVKPGVEVYVPFRVVANRDESEVLFTIFRLPEMDDQAFKDDVAMVRKDLQNLKAVLEKSASSP